MGGLTAVWRTDGGPADPAVLAGMIAAAPHRGPAATPYLRGPIALGSQLGPGAPKEPRIALSGPLSLVVTGRLYNVTELRRELGCPLEDQEAAPTQAGLILAAWQRWGEGCLERLDGDFAFLLHDAAARSILAVRDPFGMRPLHFARCGRLVLLASEPKQILAAGLSAEPCEATIAAYLALDRSLFSGPRTFFDQVHRVEPGHLVRLDALGDRTRRYWQLSASAKVAETTEADMAMRVRGLLTEAVARRIPEAPPWGCALSGGFDSSTVAAIYRRQLDDRGIAETLTTFSFEMRDPAADEAELIELVAQEVRADHTRIFLDQDDVFDVLPSIVHAADQPQYDMGLLYLWRKKEAAAARGVKVLLSGLGGDEIFLGRYHYFADLVRSLRWRTFWNEFRAVYPIDRSTGRRTTWSRLTSAYVLSPLLPPAAKRAIHRTLLRRPVLHPWIRPELAARTGLAERLRAGPARIFEDAYRQDCWEVFQYILLDLTIPIHEAMSAATGVDTRFPLLDRRLVEYMFAVPRELKIGNGGTRLLQRQAMAGLLPEVVTREHLKKNMNPVLWRQQRPNFDRELAKLMAQGSLLCAAYVPPDALAELYARHRASGGMGESGFILWYILSLERWLQSIARGGSGSP